MRAVSCARRYLGGSFRSFRTLSNNATRLVLHDNELRMPSDFQKVKNLWNRDDCKVYNVASSSQSTMPFFASLNRRISPWSMSRHQLLFPTILHEEKRQYVILHHLWRHDQELEPNQAVAKIRILPKEYQEAMRHWSVVCLPCRPYYQPIVSWISSGPHKNGQIISVDSNPVTFAGAKSHEYKLNAPRGVEELVERNIQMEILVKDDDRILINESPVALVYQGYKSLPRPMTSDILLFAKRCTAEINDGYEENAKENTFKFCVFGTLVFLYVVYQIWRYLYFYKISGIWFRK